MTAQIAASGSLPIELVAAVVVISMLLGAVDILRQPGWAWKQAEESQVAYLILDLLLPVIGLGLYAFRARPKVTALVAAGPAADRSVDIESETADPEVSQPEPVTPADPAATPPTAVPAATAPPNRFTSFREVTGAEPGNGSVEAPPDTDPAGAFEISSTFFSTGAATRTVRHPLALARAYRPRQRTSLSESEPRAESQTMAESKPMADPQLEVRSQPEPAIEPEVEPEPELVDEVPTVPSGWKVDPTGRHQFRFWDGYHWTENVADDGAESRDAVSA